MSKFNEDEDIAFVRDVRKQLIREMTKDEDGKIQMPTETKDRMVLLTALNDMDRTSLSLKKIKSDEGIADMQAQAAATIAALYKDPNLKNIDVVDVVAVDITEEERVKRIPKFDTTQVQVEIMPGELDINPVNESFDEFMARQKKLQ